MQKYRAHCSPETIAGFSPLPEYEDVSLVDIDRIRRRELGLGMCLKALSAHGEGDGFFQNENNCQTCVLAPFAQTGE